MTAVLEAPVRPTPLLLARKPEQPITAPSAPAEKWCDPELVERMRAELMQEFGDRIGELPSWQQKLLPVPVPPKLPESWLKKYYFAARNAKKQLMPAPARKPKSGPATPHPRRPLAATVRFGKDESHPHARPATTVDCNGWGQTHREPTAKESADSAAALAKQAGLPTGPPNTQSVVPVTRGSAIRASDKLKNKKGKK